MGPKLTVFVVVENIVVGEQFLISVRYGWVGVLVQRWGEGGGLPLTGVPEAFPNAECMHSETEEFVYKPLWS